MEFNLATTKLLIAEQLDFLSHNTEHRFVKKPDVIRAYNYCEMNEKLFGFLDKLVALQSGNRETMKKYLPAFALFTATA
ncbi:hypothetical protein [Lonepinella sp. MS14436]|uniref:hypothetical protein n=1 Tax=Lonepinella sp. MS14436 TaxID=3003619 RepID=UPI0036DD323F